MSIVWLARVGAWVASVVRTGALTHKEIFYNKQLCSLLQTWGCLCSTGQG